MAVHTSNIQWTKYTWNPWTGCHHVSPACDFCYAERTIEGRFGRDFKKVNRSKEATFKKPVKIAKGIRPDSPLQDRLVFTCSWSDFFHKQADLHRPEAWDIIRNSPLVYQILTKRIHRGHECLPLDWWKDLFRIEKDLDTYKNVWLGTTVENIDSINRIAWLVSNQAFVNFLSIEPLLEDIGDNFYRAMQEVHKSIHWVILGGESGNDTGKYLYRPSKLEWYENIIQICDHFKIPVFFKQTGTFLSKELGLADREGGDILDTKFPSSLQRREFPILPSNYLDDVNGRYFL